jgi:hypothetical protein
VAVRLALGALAIVAAVLSGCGDEDEPQTDPSAEATEIAITLDPDGKGGEAPLTESVICPGAASAVCDAVAALPEDPAAPVPAQTACTEIYGGPDTLMIEGTLRGEPVEAEFTRANGCEIERFERFAPLLFALFPEYTPGESLAP